MISSPSGRKLSPIVNHHCCHNRYRLCHTIILLIIPQQVVYCESEAWKTFDTLIRISTCYEASPSHAFLAQGAKETLGIIVILNDWCRVGMILMLLSMTFMLVVMMLMLVVVILKMYSHFPQAQERCMHLWMPVAPLEADEPRPSLSCDRLATARAPAADDCR